MSWSELWQSGTAQILLAVAVMAAIGQLYSWVRGLYLMVKSLLDKIESRREGEEADKALLRQMAKEFKPNHGGSMKDALDRVESGLKTVSREVGVLSQRQLQMHNLDLTGIWETDSQGLCNYVNPAMARLADATPDDFLGTGWKNLVHPDDRGALTEAWAAAVVEQRDFHFSYRFRNGVAVRVTGRRVFATGEIVGWIGDCHKQRVGDA